MDQTEKNDHETDILTEKLLRTRSIILSGEVNKTSAEKVIKEILVLESEGEDPIKVFINSPGGDVESGFAIFDIARFVTNDVYMIGTGLVASAAALILLAVPAKYRLGLPNSSYLIHQPMSRMEGVATDIEIYTRQLERLRDRLNEIISEQTGQPLHVVRADTDRDHWMNAGEALTYGLISKVIRRREDI